MVRKGIEMQAKARDRSVRLMRSASRELGKLASQLEGSGKPARRKKRKSGLSPRRSAAHTSPLEGGGGNHGHVGASAERVAVNSDRHTVHFFQRALGEDFLRRPRA